MPSAFPGVDPYLESQSYWEDFHLRFINYWCEAIAERLPERYEARIDERMNLVEIPAEETRRIRPAVAVVRQTSARRLSAQSSPGAATLEIEPVTIPLKYLDEYRQAYIEVFRRPGRQLVAVLELLSPSNKLEPGRRDYLAKRNALMVQAVHLVELDLLVGGYRLPMEEPLPVGNYYPFVARSDRRPDCDVFAWTIRDRLPTIPIPLMAPDPDVRVDLSSVYGLAYDRGRYARSIDYRAPLTVSLSAADIEWAEKVAT
jgi:hypothetical protein